MPPPPPPPPPAVVCCGLSTLDMHLHACQLPLHLEHVTPFSHTTTAPGGSAPQVALALRRLCVHPAVLTVVGADAHARDLRLHLDAAGVDTAGLVTDAAASTALAVLPLYADGRRGCLVTLGANLCATPDTLLDAARSAALLSARLRVFHFGYPHLMPRLRGPALAALFRAVRAAAPAALLSLDLNGANVADEDADHPVVMPALPLVALVHANAEEAAVVSGRADPAAAPALRGKALRDVAQWFTARGAALAVVTAGRDGVVAATARADVLRARCLPPLEPDVCVRRAAFAVAPGVEVNASGAGDSFVAGALAWLVRDGSDGGEDDGDGGVDGGGGHGLLDVLDASLAGALRTIDPTLVGKGADGEDVRVDIGETVRLARLRERIPVRDGMDEGMDVLPEPAVQRRGSD